MYKHSHRCVWCVYYSISNPQAKRGLAVKTSAHLGHFYCPILGYLMPEKPRLTSILKGFQIQLQSLCSGWGRSTGLTSRTSVHLSRIFANKWSILIELSSTFGVVNQAVSANAVPDHVISIQGTQATALQWPLLAVTTINNNRERWPGSVVQCINKHTG